MQYCTAQELLTLRDGEHLTIITFQGQMVDNIPVITSNIRWDFVDNLSQYLGNFTALAKELFISIHNYLLEMDFPDLSMTRDCPPFLEFRIEPEKTQLVVKVYTPYNFPYGNAHEVFGKIELLATKLNQQINDLFNTYIGDSEEMTPNLPMVAHMTTDEFWEIINYSLGETEILRETLSKFNYEQLFDFMKWYSYFHVNAQRTNLWLAFQMIYNTSMIEFGFFIDWLISQGETTYKQIIATPDMLGTMDINQEMQNAKFGNVMIDICCDKFEPISTSSLQKGFYMEPIDKGNIRNPKVLSRLFPTITAKLNQK